MKRITKMALAGAVFLGPLAAGAATGNTTPGFGYTFNTAQNTTGAHSDVPTTGWVPPAVDEQSMVGTVTGYTYNQKGHITGLTLNDGTNVTFKKGADRVAQIAAPGDTIRVDGWATRQPGKAGTFTASRISDLQTGESKKLASVAPALVPGVPSAPNDLSGERMAGVVNNSTMVAR